MAHGPGFCSGLSGTRRLPSRTPLRSLALISEVPGPDVRLPGFADQHGALVEEWLVVGDAPFPRAQPGVDLLLGAARSLGCGGGISSPTASSPPLRSPFSL